MRFKKKDSRSFVIWQSIDSFEIQKFLNIESLIFVILKNIKLGGLAL